MKKNPSSHWNYRLLYEVIETPTFDSNGNKVMVKVDRFFFAEVHYENGKPCNYGTPVQMFESKKSIKQFLKFAWASLFKPTLYAGDRFPEEVKSTRQRHKY